MNSRQKSSYFKNQFWRSAKYSGETFGRFFSSFGCANFIRDSPTLKQFKNRSYFHLFSFLIKTRFQLFLSGVDDQSHFRAKLLTGQHQCGLGLVWFSNPPSSPEKTFWEAVETRRHCCSSLLRDELWGNTTPSSSFVSLTWLTVLHVQRLQVDLLPARPQKLPQTCSTLVFTSAAIPVVVGITPAAQEPRGVRAGHANSWMLAAASTLSNLEDCKDLKSHQWRLSADPVTAPCFKTVFFKFFDCAFQASSKCFISHIVALLGFLAVFLQVPK